MKTYGQFRHAVRASGRVVKIFLPFFSLFLTAAAATVSLTLFSPFAFCRVVDRAEAQREAGGGSTKRMGKLPQYQTNDLDGRFQSAPAFLILN